MEDILTSQRLALYSSSVPPASSELLKFLAQVAPDSDRREVLRQAHKLACKPRSPELAVDEDAIIREVEALEPVEAVSVRPTQLNASQKLTLFKSILKFTGDWERISKEFKGVHFTPAQLKGAWRSLKLVMREEVRLMKASTVHIDCVRWLRLAVRKLEMQLGSRRQRSQLPMLIDTRKTARRTDSLRLLAIAEENSQQEMRGINHFSQSSRSSFHGYEARPVSRALPRKIFAPDSLMLVDHQSDLT
jgi:hypothetical protein